MKSKYSFRAAKNLTLTSTVYGYDQFEAEEKASEQADNTNLDEWNGADAEDELELIDEEACDDDQDDEEEAK